MNINFSKETMRDVGKFESLQCTSSTAVGSQKRTASSEVDRTLKYKSSSSCRGGTLGTIQGDHQSLDKSSNDFWFHHSPERQVSFSSASKTAIGNQPCSDIFSLSKSTAQEYFNKGMKDFAIILEDVLKSKVIKEVQKFRLLKQMEDKKLLRLLATTESDLDRENGCVLSGSDLNGAILCNGVVSETIQEGLPREISSPLRIIQDKKVLAESAQVVPRKKRRKRLPLQLHRKEKSLLISLELMRNGSSPTDMFEKDSSSSTRYQVTSRTKSYPRTSNYKLLPRKRSSSSTTRTRKCISSDEEQEPSEDVGRDEDGMYEVERILARKRLQVKEFYDRERALSVVVRYEQRWLKTRQLSQLHSLMRWENEINTILRRNGQQILYIHNDIDNTRRKHNFTLEKSKYFYTKRRGICSRFYKMLDEYLVVECYGCQCSDDCPTKVIQSGRRYKVAIVRTKARGWGLFALEDIPSNVFVVEYVGEVLTITEGDSRRDSTYQFELNGYSKIKYLIDAKFCGNEAAFVNHSCDPNLIAVRVRVERYQSFHRIGLFSKRRIFRGEELTLNYFDGKWKPKMTFTSEEGAMECFCGALNCMRYWPQLAGNAFDDSSSDDDDKENSCSKSGR
uniref:SET domain-containing protein n=1 Tax=Setaria digitata TaxID=48799 RepID=A0A915Q6H1_9BILA